MTVSVVSRRVLPTVLVLFALLPLFYIITPLAHLFAGASWSQLERTLRSEAVLHACAASVTAAAITTILSLVFGVPTAYLLSGRSFLGKRLIEAILLIPLLLPPVVGGISQLYLYGPGAPIGAWFAAHGLALTNSLVGVVLAQSYITSPFMILAAKAGFEEVPKELKEATHTLGGGMWHVFWFVSVPLARNAILSGVLLTFARAIGEFGATMIVAYHPYTLPVEIWVQFTSGGMAYIVPIAAVVTLFALIIALLGSLRRGPRAA